MLSSSICHSKFCAHGKPHNVGYEICIEGALHSRRLDEPTCLNYPKIFWISASSFFMSPPTTLATFWPLLNSKKVGIAFTSCSFAMLCSLSTSTWRKRTFSYFSLSWPTRGATALHGPHHVAKKSTTTGPEEMRALKTTGLQNG